MLYYVDVGQQSCCTMLYCVDVRSTDVPVGDDQVKHIEFTRHLAKTFNHKYGEIFPLPAAVTGPLHVLDHLLYCCTQFETGKVTCDVDAVTLLQSRTTPECTSCHWFPVYNEAMS